MTRAEQGLYEAIFGGPPLDEEREADLRRDIAREFDRGRKKALLHTTATLLLSLAFVFGGAWGVAVAGDTRSMLLAFFLMMVGLETSVLTKLWYWVVDGRLAAAKEMRQVQLQIAAVAGQLEGLATGQRTRKEEADHAEH